MYYLVLIVKANPEEIKPRFISFNFIVHISTNMLFC